MTAEFYDVKTRQKVTAAVTGKKAYEGKSGKRYAIRGKTQDGRNLTKFVSKVNWDAAQVPVV